MSDKILTSDVRPNPLQNQGKKGKGQVVNKQNEHTKWQREQHLTHYRNVQLQELLKRPIQAENKGFQLLAKMGYKPGQALGKETGNKDTERNRYSTEPLGISLKLDRGGLGRETALRELKEKRRQLKEQRLHEERKKKRLQIVKQLPAMCLTKKTKKMTTQMTTQIKKN